MMGHDYFSPISLAQVNVLCIPAGRITGYKFDEYIRAVRAFSVIATKSLKNTSSFTRYKDGHILLNIGRDVAQHHATNSKQSGLNQKPQIVLALLDGELLASSTGEDHEQALETIDTRFREIKTTLYDGAVSSVIRFGGKQVSMPKDSFFVDLEGDGPSLYDVMQEIVGQFQLKLEEKAKPLQKAILETTASAVDAPSPSTGALDRASESGRGTVQRTNSSTTRPGVNGSMNDDATSTNAETTLAVGLMNLQAGQWPEALRLFSDSASTAKNSANHLFYGRSLEGLLTCMLLFAWAHLDFNVPQICYPTSDKKGPVYNSPSMSAICTANRSTAESVSTARSISSAHTLTGLVPQLLNTILSLFERNAGISQDDEAFRLLCQSRVRCGNLLLIMRKHGSTLRDPALQHLIEGNDTGSTGKSREPAANALILHVKALTKLFVDAALEAQFRLPVSQAAELQIAVASSLSKLGVERKQAFHLREFLQKLASALVEARRVGAAEMGIHPSAGLPPLDSLKGMSDGAARSGVQSLLESVCESYGLRKPANGSSDPQTAPEDRLREFLLLWSTAHQTGDIMMKIDILTLCIEVSDAVPDLQCSLNLMARLLQISIGRPTLIAGTSATAPFVLVDEQARIIANMQKALHAAIRYEVHDVRASYWDQCLVRFIQLSEEPDAGKLMPHTARDLSIASATRTETKRDPFIFNPFTKAKTEAGQSVIVVGELVRFDVILQNPLQVDIEIEDISLKAIGCDFESDHHSIVLGPLCSQLFTLTGTAQSPGELTITGCRATVRCCNCEDFLIVQGDWKPVRAVKSVTASTALEPLQTVTLPEIVTLPLTATAPLPRLSMTSTSLLQQSIMLLEGESISFTMTLQNDSDLDVDFVLFTFEDAVSRRLEDALNNKDLLPTDMYEIQNQIATRPVIRLIDSDREKSTIRIAAGGEESFGLEVFGRPGLTEVTIIVDYAHLGKPQDEVQGSFYTRQLRHTITTTINGSIDLPRCSVLPLEGSQLSNHLQQTAQDDSQVMSSAHGRAEDADGHCLLVLDIRNIWPSPLDVEFQVAEAAMELGDAQVRRADSFDVSATLQPGQMTRLLLIAPRILITNPYAAIPSLDTKRQFVVSVSKMSMEAEAASRESFWYREKLLSCLSATWKEQYGPRSGQIDMRKGVRLSSRMIDALRVNLVEISFSLKAVEPGNTSKAEDTVITQLGNSHFSIPRNNFACLTTRVHNLSTEVLGLVLRLQPALRHQPHNVALDLSKRFAWSGVLQRALHPPLQPGETRDVELGVIALAEGEYEINGTAEEVRSRSARQANTHIGIGGGTERRIWHARRPCLIDAVDET